MVFVESRFQLKGFLIWGIAATFFLYEFFIRTVMGTFQNPIMQDLHLSNLEFSLLSTTFFALIYGVMQVPAGIIADQVGIKKTMLFGAVICGIGALLFALTYHFSLALLSRALMGMGTSCCFICLLITVYEWMPHRYVALFIGISQFIGTLGAIVAAGPLQSFVTAHGIAWRFLFLLLAAMAALFIILILFFVMNNPQKRGSYTILKRSQKAKSAMLHLFGQAQPWLIALLSATLYFPVEYLCENEGRSFLHLKGLSLTVASYCITVAWLGFAIGCPLLGWISDSFELRNKVMRSTALMSLIAIIFFLYGRGEFLLLTASFFLGIAASGESIGFAAMAEQFQQEFTAAGLGLNSGFITTFCALMAPLFGFLLDWVGHQKSSPLAHYYLIFSLLIVIAIVGLLVASCFIKETFTKSAVEMTYLRPKIKD